MSAGRIAVGHPTQRIDRPSTKLLAEPAKPLTTTVSWLPGNDSAAPKPPPPDDTPQKSPQCASLMNPPLDGADSSPRPPHLPLPFFALGPVGGVGWAEAKSSAAPAPHSKDHQGAQRLAPHPGPARGEPFAGVHPAPPTGPACASRRA